MYGMKDSTNLDFMVGKVLDQVCFGLASVNLNFSGQVSVSIESEYEVFVNHDGASSISSEQKTDRKSLLRLIGCDVCSVEKIGDGGVSISFSNGIKLCIYDSHDSFESYSISSPGGTIVV